MSITELLADLELTEQARQAAMAQYHHAIIDRQAESELRKAAGYLMAPVVLRATIGIVWRAYINERDDDD